MSFWADFQCLFEITLYVGEFILNIQINHLPLFQSHSCANQIPSNRLEKKSQELVRVVNYLNSVKMQMNFEASKLAAAAGWSITLSSRHSHGFRISKKKVCQKFANPNTFFIMKNAKRHPLQHECNEYNFFPTKYVDFKTRLNCGWPYMWYEIVKDVYCLYPT